MRSLEGEIRDWTFWTVDRLKGGQIKNHFEDVRYMNSSGMTEDVERKRAIELKEILLHAINTTEFYKNQHYTGVIDNFPVVHKNLIRENMSKFLSGTFSKQELISGVTSGSTGTPFKVLYNSDKKKRNTADTLFFGELGGYHLGDKLFYFKIWSKNNRKSLFTRFAQNITPIEVLDIEMQSKEVLKILNKQSVPFNCLGYVSAFETLFKSLDKIDRPVKLPKVKSIITMSESLNDYTRARGEKYFQCPVLSRYSNIENGIIAQQTLNSPDTFVINRASYLIEIFHPEEDKPIKNGNLGRILITDFFNKAMPLIRYDTGDLGVKEIMEINGVKQEVFTRIEGRKLDQIYNTSGELISSYIVYKNMWKYTEIEQYQLIQKSSKAYILKICISKRFEKEAELIKEFKHYLGEDSKFSIEYVQEIPLLSSGKRKKVVNEMNRN